jgi:hypothetical protein
MRKELLHPLKQVDAPAAPQTQAEALPADCPKSTTPAESAGADSSPETQLIPVVQEIDEERPRIREALDHGQGAVCDEQDHTDLASQPLWKPEIGDPDAPTQSATGHLDETRQLPDEAEPAENREPAVAEPPSNETLPPGAAESLDPAPAEIDIPVEVDTASEGLELPAAAESLDPAPAEIDIPVEVDTASEGLELSAGDSGIDPVPAAVLAPSDPRRALAQYRPNLRERSNDATARTPAAPTGASGLQAAPGSLEADLLLAFQPGDWGISLSLLLRRPEALPEQITVQLAREMLDLSVIDEGLFEPIPLGDADDALRRGVTVEFAGDFPRRWVRTGRRLHVFTERSGVFGFASVPRVVIGQENVVLCNAALAGRVLDLCELTGSDAPKEIVGPGLPPDWRCFRNYRPRRPGSWEDDDIFLALSPLPDAAIELAGGVALSRSTWIFGCPPAIRILGSEPRQGEVTIDLQPAAQAETGQWTSPGWDSLGNHAVRFAGLLRRYEIVEVEDGWTWWPAHSGPGFALAGALARSEGGRRPVVVLQEREAWLLGARPGEAVRAVALPGAHGTTAAPSFAPVWAIPPKTRRRPMARLLDSPETPQAPATETRPEAIRLWGQVVRDAAKLPAGGGAAAAELWQQYQTVARRLKRRAR